MTFLLNAASQIICTHGAPATTVPSQTRVLLSGQPALVVSDMPTVAGCPFQIPIPSGTKPQPCVTIQWLVPATRVRINGQPALLQTSTGLCKSAEQIPQGPPTVVVTQPRVKGM